VHSFYFWEYYHERLSFGLLIIHFTHDFLYIGLIMELLAKELYFFYFFENGFYPLLQIRI
jgi:hypothetical protein